MSDLSPEDDDHPMHMVAVAGLVTNATGGILLVRSARRGWEFPGGQVEPGESLTQGLMREIEEEAGVVVRVGPLVGVYSVVTPPTKVIFGFLADYLSGELVCSAESSETIWASPEEAQALVTYPSYIDRLRDFVTFSGRVTYRSYTSDPYQVVEERMV